MTLAPQDFRKVHSIHRLGLAADRPAPTDVLEGTLYFSTDTLVLERSDGVSWAIYASPSSGAEALHYRADTTATTPSDPGTGKIRWNNVTQNLATTLIFDWLTTDGFDAHNFLKLMSVDDKFVIQDTDLAVTYQIWNLTGPAINHPDWFEVPVAFVEGSGVFSNNEKITLLVRSGAGSGGVATHHVTHETGGTDPITSVSGAIVTSGTVADARLSANVPLKNVNNIFTESQQIVRTFPILTFEDTSQPVDQKKFRFFSTAGSFYLQAVNDAVSDGQGIISINRAGNFFASGVVTERNRTVPMGEWINIPFVASNFYSDAPGMTWTVAAGDILTNRYMLIGKTLFWHFYVSTSTLGGTISYYVRMVLPNNYMGASHLTHPIGYFDNNPIKLGILSSTLNSNVITITPRDPIVYNAGAFGLRFSIALEIQ